MPARVTAPARELGLPRYTVSLARDQDDVRAAQRLRYDIFVGILGAPLDIRVPGHDTDPFDVHCDHLLVRERSTGTTVGTYRLLPPERARAIGRTFSDEEFDLGRLTAIRSGLVDGGRACVHPDHRNGLVIALLWAGLARYLVRGRHSWLGGCCSVQLQGGEEWAARVWRTATHRHLSPQEYRVVPRRPWPLPTTSAEPLPPTAMPPLIRGNLRVGAWVCGEPSYDPPFNSLSLYMLLPMRRIKPQYLNRFLALAPA
ncbi:GNAT family N-acetyltransferase [Streptomyces sp. URMC 123]|uniref:GNAT family N-acetyltransferase n=1 Tax=Streptomyces sp. URMC 123 TaxID=3423403 RepID=UPI003F1CC142